MKLKSLSYKVLMLRILHMERNLKTSTEENVGTLSLHPPKTPLFPWITHKVRNLLIYK